MVKNSPLKINFPVGYCIPTKKLNKLNVKRLTTLLTSEGHILVKHEPSDFLRYGYIGVNHYGDIHYYSEPCSYLPLGNRKGNNVLSEYWLEDYLNQLTEVAV